MRKIDKKIREKREKILIIQTFQGKYIAKVRVDKMKSANRKQKNLVFKNKQTKR